MHTQASLPACIPRPPNKHIMKVGSTGLGAACTMVSHVYPGLSKHALFGTSRSQDTFQVGSLGSARRPLTLPLFSISDCSSNIRCTLFKYLNCSYPSIPPPRPKANLLLGSLGPLFLWFHWISGTITCMRILRKTWV